MAINTYIENGKKLYEIYVNGFDSRGIRVQRRKKGLDTLRKAEMAEFELKRELAKLKEEAVPFRWSEWLVVVNWFYNESYGFVRPKISYAFSDAFRGTIGYEKNYGPTASLFGRIKDMSSGFAELRWLF